MNITKHIPNTITSMNLLCGVLGVILTMKGNLNGAFILMIAAAGFDFFDGLAARLLNAKSLIGKELDSLSDLISFGVLPSLMLYKTMAIMHGEDLLTYIPLILVIFSALRLAKFNIDDRQYENFLGLATPSSAMICGSLSAIIDSNTCTQLSYIVGKPYFIPVLAVILSGLLISNIPMFSLKLSKQRLANKTLRIKLTGFITTSLIIALAIIVTGLDWKFIILSIFTIYIIENITFALFAKR
ncbi:MAG: CDP-diacylglycerol--serine O-phosphatidyltransferase [Candidatus Cryptobacteroides sp.]